MGQSFTKGMVNDASTVKRSMLENWNILIRFGGLEVIGGLDKSQWGRQDKCQQLEQWLRWKGWQWTQITASGSKAVKEREEGSGFIGTFIILVTHAQKVVLFWHLVSLPTTLQSPTCWDFSKLDPCEINKLLSISTSTSSSRRDYGKSFLTMGQHSTRSAIRDLATSSDLSWGSHLSFCSSQALHQNCPVISPHPCLCLCPNLCLSNASPSFKIHFKYHLPHEAVLQDPFQVSFSPWSCPTLSSQRWTSQSLAP